MEIIVEWTRPEGGNVITQYFLQWKNGTTYHSMYIIHNSGQSQYSYTITNLSPATTYNVRIRTINSAGSGSFTAYTTATTGTLIN